VRIGHKKHKKRKKGRGLWLVCQPVRSRKTIGHQRIGLAAKRAQKAQKGNLWASESENRRKTWFSVGD
jgi:hypothetical protein